MRFSIGQCGQLFDTQHRMIPVQIRSFFILRLLLAALVAAAPILAGPAPARAQSPDRFTYLTEEYYPFNYTEDGRVMGLSVDVLRMVWKQLDVPDQPIEILPWARAVELTEHQPGTVLFGMARTPHRESRFRWAGPIVNVRFVLIAKKAKHIRIKSLDRLGGYCIGTVRGDIAHTLISPHLSECTLEAVADMKQNVRKLIQDRLDMVAYEEHSWPALVARMGIDPEQFETVFVLSETPIYFAFHPDTPTRTVSEFQKALDAVKASGEYRSMLKNHLK